MRQRGKSTLNSCNSISTNKADWCSERNHTWKYFEMWLLSLRKFTKVQHLNSHSWAIILVPLGRKSDAPVDTLIRLIYIGTGSKILQTVVFYLYLRIKSPLIAAAISKYRDERFHLWAEFCIICEWWYKIDKIYVNINYGVRI